MSEQSDAYEIDPMAYVGSTVGNAFFSGVTMEELFSCVCQADSVRTPEALDAAVSATIELKDLVGEHSTRADGGDTAIRNHPDKRGN